MGQIAKVVQGPHWLEKEKSYGITVESVIGINWSTGQLKRWDVSNKLIQLHESEIIATSYGLSIEAAEDLKRQLNTLEGRDPTPSEPKIKRGMTKLK